MATQTRNPTSDLAVSGNFSGTAGTRYTLVDDHPDSAGTDYLELQSQGGGHIVFGHSVFTIPAGSTIDSLGLTYYHRKPVAGGTASSGRVRVGGVDFDAASFNSSESWALRDTDTWTVNPATGIAWTVDDINGTGANPLQGFGIAGTDWNPDVYIASIQAVVTYTLGVATHLAFDEQPTDAPYDIVIDPPVTVFALNDAEEIDTSFTDDVTIAIDTNPGTGVLSGTLTIAAVAGVATFDDLTIDEIGVGYTLTATATGLDAAPASDAFDIIDQTADHLTFLQEPTNVVEGVAISPSITVEARKPDTTVDTSFVGNITIAIGTNPTGGVLSGTVTQAAVAGVATFNDLEISVPGTGYTLIATGTGLTQDTSATFNVTLEAATHLVFFVGPSDTQVDAIITPEVKVRARNSENVVDTNYTGDITLAIQTNPPGTGVLGGDLTVAAVAGVATFSDLTIDEAGVGYVLRATASGLTLADSATFDITSSPPPSTPPRAFSIRMGAPLTMRL